MLGHELLWLLMIRQCIAGRQMAEWGVQTELQFEQQRTWRPTWIAPQLLASWKAMKWLKLVGLRYSSSMGGGRPWCLCRKPRYRVMPSNKLRQVRGLSEPGLSSCTGLVHQLFMASSWSARGPCSSMVGLHSLRPYLSCSCEAAMVQAGRCLGSSCSGGAGCDWDGAVEPGWGPPAAAAGCCRTVMSSAGVSAQTPPRLLTTVLCNERRPQARTAVDLLRNKALGALGLREPSLMRPDLSGCVASLVQLPCTPAGQ